MTTVEDKTSSASRFPTETAWSIILASHDSDSPERKSRFDTLVARYWKPVCWFLTRAWKLPPADAADLTQEFFLQLYERDSLKEAAPERGRFRTFLKLKLRNLVVDELRRRSALKRGGDRRTIPMDAESAAREPAWEGLTPEEAFDRDWASCLLVQSLQELSASMTSRGKKVVYDAFWNACVADPPRSYRETAALLGIKEADVTNYVFRARAELREIVRKGVRESVERESAVEEELAYVFRLFEG